MASLVDRRSIDTRVSGLIMNDVLKDANTIVMQAQRPDVTEESLNIVWDSLGKYLSRNMRNGRGVIIPKFGQFTFTAPVVTLNGVTNPNDRDLQSRVPVFLISPEFYKGSGLKTAMFYQRTNTMRPYTNSGLNGKMQLVKCNFVEVGHAAGVDKDLARTCIERVCKKLADSVRSTGRAHMVLPTIGVFHVKDGMSAVAYDEGLGKDVFKISNTNLSAIQRKSDAKQFLTLDRMDQYQLSQSGYDVENKDYQSRFMSIDPEGLEYLKSLDIKTNAIKEQNYRPLSATVNYNNLSLKKSMRDDAAQDYKNESAKFFGTSSVASNRYSIGKSNSFMRPVSAAVNSLKDQVLYKEYTQSIKNSQQLANTERKISDKRLQSLGKKRLGLWMRQTNVMPMDGFFMVIAKKYGSQVNRNQKVTVEEFAQCLVDMEINIDFNSAECMSNEIASLRQDGLIDAVAFMDFISEEDKDPQNMLRDVIYLNGLKFEDILKTMDIPKETAKLDYFKLKDGIKRVDPGISRLKSEELAKLLLNEKDSITVYDFVEQLEGINAGNNHKEDLSSNLKVIQKIRLALLEHQNPNLLQDEFERFDKNSTGLIDPAAFKTCFIKLKDEQGITIGEINRLGRYIDRDLHSNIDYVKFQKDLDKQLIKASLKNTGNYNAEMKFSLTKFCDNINKYMDHFKLSKRMFLRRVSGDNEDITEEEQKYAKIFIKVPSFFMFIRDYIVNTGDDTDKYISDTKLRSYCEKIDIDKDGSIDFHDFNVFLSRNIFLENSSKRLVDTVKSSYGQDLTTRMNNILEGKTLYPTDNLSNSKIDLVLRNLRGALLSKNLGYHEFFNRLDRNKDGLITYNEFDEGMKEYIKFSDITTKSLFAYFDRQKIGMVDFNNFMKVMKKSGLDKLVEKYEDNFDWQVDVLHKIRQWYYKLDMSSEDAFRIIDTDYDRKINKKDLNHFLKVVLQIPVEEQSSSRIDRLFNLIDLYRNGQIGYEDFKRILTDCEDVCENPIVNGKRPTNKMSFDWQLKAKQQIGFFLNRNYKSLDDSYDVVTNKSVLCTYAMFKQWVELKNVLSGFNLTDFLMQELFSDLDPHKKGHLVLNDWLTSFDGYKSDELHLVELQDFISSSFFSATDAWNLFIKHAWQQEGEGIDLHCFKLACCELLPNRFTEKDLEKIWDKLVQRFDTNVISKVKFLKLFEGQSFCGSLKLTPATVNKSFRSRVMTRSQTETNVKRRINSRMQAIEPNLSDIHSKLRMFAKSSAKSLAQVFSSRDPDNTGNITNLQFRDSIRELNIGQVSKEIDVQIKYCRPDDNNMINWHNFIHKFKESDGEKQVLDRTRQRLHKIKDQIYLFQLSPKDAFNQYNEDRSGQLNFDDFHNMIKHLSVMSSDTMPTFIVVKDLFNYIDTKRDGYIDIHEWMETFRRIEVPIKSAHQQHIVLNPNGRAFSEFEGSQKFDNIIKIISKNRKFLQAQFQGLQARGARINFEATKEILQGLLGMNGTRLEPKFWPLLINFAEKDGFVDYRYLLDRYKERTQMINLHPNPILKNNFV